jgi:ubiquitin-protein ligase
MRIPLKCSLSSLPGDRAVTAFEERRNQDVQKLRDLEAKTSDRVRIVHVGGRPPSEIEVELQFRTASSKQYPSVIQNVTRLLIRLPARYPFVEPVVNIVTPIIHPNIYPSGRVCLGLLWVPSFGLDLLVQRIIQIVTYDPTILNEASPANYDALLWYREARKANAWAFPTDRLMLSLADRQKAIKWVDKSPAAVASPPANLTIVSCPTCRSQVQVPAAHSPQLQYNCPKCGKAFWW